MLEKLPASLGRALRHKRPGLDELVIGDPALADIDEGIVVSSAAFLDGDELPVRFTADGEGVSPPLEWSGVPEDAAAVVLLIEDADSPTRHPLVHAIVWDLDGSGGALREGVLPRSGGEDGLPTMGRNSYLRAGYLPPDPPPGHGTHRYAVQIFALDRRPRFDATPGRSRLVDCLRRHALAKGMLIGTYERR
ncbi:MAG TPA: YbhB/YbcL family Raf kinase inhibitor-like protein [Stellaceae bacterium]|jgi:hypothetical protein|nr:YbhB/YbcL family Raf kinase inhibitor-like protein [Stellaceae bacterium]